MLPGVKELLEVQGKRVERNFFKLLALLHADANYVSQLPALQIHVELVAKRAHVLASIALDGLADHGDGNRSLSK